MRHNSLLIFTGCWLATTSWLLADDAREAFFESKIRPALVEHCLDCHSVDSEASGGLTLDSAAATLAGGDSGPAIVPGEPLESLLLTAIGYDDVNLQMPPDGKLPNEVVADFRKWIQQGAYDPREEMPQEKTGQPKKEMGLSVERAQEHWAYRPLTDATGKQTSLTEVIDQSIDRKLKEKELSPTPAVSPASFARRVYYDLTGLPPTPQQLAAFELACEQADSIDLAYATLVDELLASSQYGEHFARKWMDVARYADSITLRGFVLPNAWRYRDYLISAYNTDRAFDQMIVEHVAGDLLELPSEDIAEQQRVKIASGFLALGNTNLEQQDKAQLEMDYIDEQLEVVGRAFLGQTIGCARCHDHKFDPIPTKDYYALAGIFKSAVGLEHANVSKWIEHDLPLTAEEQDRKQAIEANIAKTTKRLKELKTEQKASGQELKGAIDPKTLEGIIIDDSQAQRVGFWKESQYFKTYIGAGYLHDEGKDKGNKTLTFEAPNLEPGIYEVSLAFSVSSNRATSLSVRVFSAEGEETVLLNQKEPREYDGLWRKLGRFRFEKDGQAYVLISTEGSYGTVIADAVRFLRVDNRNSEAVEKSQAMLAKLDSEIKQAEQHLQQLKKRLTKVSPKYLSVNAGHEPQDIAIHVRGNVHTLAAEVPRGYLTALNVPDAAKVDVDRLDFANWLVSSANPLTPRVYVNRVWSWLMGRGLVSSINNFGTTGTAPTHPELLDALALRFVQSGWSSKYLVKSIVLSDAYRRSAHGGSEVEFDSDPNNEFYWRGARRRLSAEALRDAMLMISGELKPFEGGSLIPAGTNADYNFKHTALTRSVYLPVFRNSLPDLYEVFDFADASVSVGSRARSTVAPQALALMNHPWVIARANSAAARFAREELDARALVELIFMHCYARPPTEEESKLCEKYLSSANTDGENLESRLRLLMQSLFAAVDFRYLD